MLVCLLIKRADRGNRNRLFALDNSFGKRDKEYADSRIMTDLVFRRWGLSGASHSAPFYCPPQITFPDL